MVNIPENAIAQTFVGKKRSSKEFFVITDVFFRIWPLETTIM